jgi:hypothetical protein
MGALQSCSQPRAQASVDVSHTHVLLDVSRGHPRWSGRCPGRLSPHAPSVLTCSFSLYVGGAASTREPAAAFDHHHHHRHGGARMVRSGLRARRARVLLVPTAGGPQRAHLRQPPGDPTLQPRGTLCGARQDALATFLARTWHACPVPKWAFEHCVHLPDFTLYMATHTGSVLSRSHPSPAHA